MRVQFQSLSRLQWLAAILGLLALLCFGWLLLLWVAPGGASIDLNTNDADIRFAVDRWLVPNDGDCVTVSWLTINNDSVFYDGDGVIGEGSETWCIDAPQDETELRVVFRDGTEATYTLTVRVMAFEPLVWVLLLVGFTALSGLIWLGVGRAASKPIAKFMPRLLPLVQGILWFAFSLGTALILAEVGLRYHFSNHGSIREQQLYLYTDDQLRAEAVEQPMPFLNIAPVPGGENNRLGYRGEEVAIPKPGGVFRILTLGDSTTHGIGVSPQNTYTEQLERILTEDYSIADVEAINGGVPGYTTWGHVVNLAFRGLELEPDLIIVYSAVLDISALMVEPSCYRGDNLHRGIPPQSPMFRIGGEPLPGSALYRFIGIQQGWMDSPTDTNRLLTSVIDCPPTDLSPEALASANPPVYYERNLRTLVGIGMGHDIPVLVSTWGYDANEDHATWWRQIVDDMNQRVRRVADETDTLFYDLAASDFVDTPEYWFGDGIHQSIEGHREQAQRFAAYLVEAGVFEP